MSDRNSRPIEEEVRKLFKTNTLTSQFIFAKQNAQLWYYFV